MAPPPPKRKLIDLVNEDTDVQPAPAQQHSPPPGATQGVRPIARDAKEDQDEDFMSDAYLKSSVNAANAPATKSRRRLPQAFQEPKDEEAQRFLGLTKNLMDAEKEGGLGTEANKAMRMMMLMGYEPGKALGVDRREEAEARAGSDDGKGAAVHEDVQTSGAAASAPYTSDTPAKKSPTPHLLEPILPNTSRLGSGASARRGIGSLSTLISRAAAAHSHAEERARQAQQSTQQLQDYRVRSALLAKETHQRKLLERGRKTCWELDKRETAGKEEAGGEGEYSPLWLDERWFTVKSGDLPAEVALLVERAVGDELVDNEEGEVDDTERGQEGTASDDQSDRRPSAEPLTRRIQTRQFLSLTISTRLAITLDHLRTHHHYCLFCGVQYESQEDLQASCPGEEEDDHD